MLVAVELPALALRCSGHGCGRDSAFKTWRQVCVDGDKVEFVLFGLVKLEEHNAGCDIPD